MGKITLYLEPVLEQAARDLGWKKDGNHKTQEIFREAIRFWVEHGLTAGPHLTKEYAHVHGLLEAILRRGNEDEVKDLITTIEQLVQGIAKREQGLPHPENPTIAGHTKKLLSKKP